jgi:hypothetical protein
MERIDPSGAWRDDYRIALLGMHLKSCWTQGTVGMAEFMPNFEPVKPQSTQQMQSTVRPVFAKIEALLKKRNGQGTQNKTGSGA